MVYIVLHGSTLYYEKDIIKAFSTLEKANNYVKNYNPGTSNAKNIELKVYDYTDTFEKTWENGGGKDYIYIYAITLE